MTTTAPKPLVRNKGGRPNQPPRAGESSTEPEPSATTGPDPAATERLGVAGILETLGRVDQMLAQISELQAMNT
jgi:hypothetical protein